MLNRKIPSVDSNSGWDHIPIKKIDDKLIPVSTISERMIVKPQYFLQSIPDAINEIYLREKVVERLLKSLKKLPDPYAFILYDGWRSFSVQQYLYNKYCKVLSEKYPKLNNIQIQQLASKSVSKPEQSEIKPSPHLTGLVKLFPFLII